LVRRYATSSRQRGRLREVAVIGPVRATSILAIWAEQKAVREGMVSWHSHDVGPARAVRISKPMAMPSRVMTENPLSSLRDITNIVEVMFDIAYLMLAA
jgi:exodeoxyribonuclease V alpha subunit